MDRFIPDPGAVIFALGAIGVVLWLFAMLTDRRPASADPVEHEDQPNLSLEDEARRTWL